MSAAWYTQGTMLPPLVVSSTVSIPASAIRVTAVRASGPGGQNVNKVSSKVDVRVDLAAIVGLDEGARARLHEGVAGRVDSDGCLYVTSQKTRDREKNLADAFDKIRRLVAGALVVPKTRRSTRPRAGAVRARLQDKRRNAERKAGRAARPEDSTRGAWRRAGSHRRPGSRVALGLGPRVDDETRRALGNYLALVLKWNGRMDLTAARHEDELVDLMVADALLLAARLPPGVAVVDVGSGGSAWTSLGLARPDLRITLVEPLQKRVAFLRTVIGTLFPAASGPKVVRARGDELPRGAFDVAISRATLSPDRWLALGHELAPRGDVWVLLAREPPPVHPERNAAEDVRYRWPLTQVERRAVRYCA